MAIETETETPVVTPTPEPEESLRDTIEAAYDAAAEPVEAPVEQPVEAPAAELELEPQPRDPHGRFAPREGAPAEKPVVEKPVVEKPVVQQPLKPGEKPVVQQPLKPGEKPPAPKPEPVKAPQSWTPAEREAWNQLPPVAQQAVARREREMAQRLEEGARYRQTAEQFAEVVRPFEGFIRAAGHTPMQSVYGLLQTAAALQTGTAENKAIIAANIIRAYGVDVEQLAAALDGEPAARDPRGGPQSYRDPRVDQLVAELRARDEAMLRQQQAQEQRELSALESSYKKFAETHDFFEDVRGDMADIIRLKAEQGVAVDDETAYNMAVALRPDLTDILRSREEAQRATNPNGSTARARAAAGSIAHKPVVREQLEADPEDLRAVIEAAYDRASGRA